MAEDRRYQPLAQPLHIQRLEASLNMGPFMSFAQTLLQRPLTSSDESDVEINNTDLGGGDKIMNGITISRNDRRSDKQIMFNLTNVGPDRKWLQDLLLSDTDSDGDLSDEDEYIRGMLKDHIRERKYRTKYYQNTNNAQFGYYSTGLLSTHDHFNEHQRSIIGVTKQRKKYKRSAEKPPKVPKTKKQQKHKGGNGADQLDDIDVDGMDATGDWDDQASSMRDESNDVTDGQSPLTKRARKKALLAKTPEMMAARRRKVWQLMAKKELGKVQRAKVNNHKEVLTGCKRVATLCMKIFRQKAMQSQKNMKETIWRAKRLTREMQGYWKRYDRVERETRRRMEKEAEEQRKHDVELVEAKRQQRKLNFLITQTELYAHFMSRKLGHGSEEEQLKILNQLDEEANPRLAAIDDYNSERMKQIAQKNAQDAFKTDRARTKQFDGMAGIDLATRSMQQQHTTINPIDDSGNEEFPQPNIFQGMLKGYQTKGMNWLANLYNQGISGILADEMGLGKTVQSIAFLCHIAETYGVWGPFLIISPASTLHNWQQEMQRFVPDFNVVPYWGSPNERKILRQFWEQKDLHTKDASFHVVITSYQLVVSDYKYFNRIKWQYMILDEAQAIKSSSSVRWKLLLGFNCRNRLLLSGTPIQNSMAELWALLHFIMPTLFDSHDEFNEWFSKDIESHAENKTGIDEKQISRLHMILKPFMLRRIKKDVENELSDKIEIMVYCPLTTRQKLLYMALKRKIRIEDLLQYADRGADGTQNMDKNITSNLMNLVMQFRKVCNHPELFERRDARSPFSFKCEDYIMPRLVYDQGQLYKSFPIRNHLLYNKFSIFKTENVQRSLFPLTDADRRIDYSTKLDLKTESAFSFSRFCDLSPNEIEKTALAGLIYLILKCKAFTQRMKELSQQYLWKCVRQNDDNDEKQSLPLYTMLLEPTFGNGLNLLYPGLATDPNSILFTSVVSDSPIFTFTDHNIHSMAETMEHRIIRSKHSPAALKLEIKEEPLFNEFEMLSASQSGAQQILKSSPISPTTSPTTTTTTTASTSKTDRPHAASHGSHGHGHHALVPEFHHLPLPMCKLRCQPTTLPTFVQSFAPKIQCNGRRQYVDSRAARWEAIRHELFENAIGRELMLNALKPSNPPSGWSNIVIPDKQTLISDAGKLSVLDGLLTRLKAQHHRVLIYSQMTKVIDLLEEYMWHRKHRYMRLDGSSKISARRDMVADFQNRSDIFVFLLSTRAGGLGINLTAADTVIFYDSDWNPTVDQQAMDRAHRLGQTKQVTVYRLICKGTIEERILQRAREKSEIQRMVISGGNFKPDTLKPKEVVSLLLDDEEIELKYRQRNEERKASVSEDFIRSEREKDKKRKAAASTTVKSSPSVEATKKPKIENGTSTSTSTTSTSVSTGNNTNTVDIDLDQQSIFDPSTGAPSPVQSDGSGQGSQHDDSSNEALVVDCDSPNRSTTPVSFSFDVLGKPRRRHPPRGAKRGRPRGSRRGGGNAGTITGRSATPGATAAATAAAATTTTPTTTSGESSSQPSESPLSSLSSSQQSTTLTPVKRGPGRPRLKPSGPGHQGTRGSIPRPRKPVGPLVVPLGSSPAPTPPGRSPAMSPAPSPAPSLTNLSQLNYYQQPSDDDSYTKMDLQID